MSLSIKKQLNQNNTDQLTQWNRKLTNYILEKGYASTIEQGLDQRRGAAIKFTIDGTTYRVSCIRSHNWYKIFIRDHFWPISYDTIHAHPKYVAIKAEDPKTPRFSLSIYKKMLDELFGGDE